MDTIKPRQRGKGLRELFRTPTFLFSLLAVALSVVIFVIVYLSGTIYIIDGNRTIVAVTMEQDFHKILAREQIPVTSNDFVELKAGGGSFSRLSITRAFPVQVTVDGATTTYYVTGGTVGQLLVGNGIHLAPRDEASLPNYYELASGDHVVVTRVESHLRVETEVIPYHTVRKSTSVIAFGRTRLLEEGSNGTLQYTYEDIVENGEVVESVLVDTTVIKPAADSVLLVGDGSPISILDYSSEFPLDANGNPVRYTQVYRNQKATGYSAKKGAYGAAVYSAARNHPDIGTCVPGTVAINPELIPYGTRLYIKTPNGNFIYGYAIANDTGIGMMDGTVTVDLFYDTYLESALNSLRYVDIYVLD